MRILFVKEILVYEWEEWMDVGKVDVEEDILALSRWKDVDAYCI